MKTKVFLLNLILVIAGLAMNSCDKDDVNTTGIEANLSLYPAGSSQNDTFAETVRKHYLSYLGSNSEISMQKTSTNGCDNYKYTISSPDESNTVHNKMLQAKSAISSVTSQIDANTWYAHFAYSTESYCWTKCDNMAAGTWTGTFTDNSGATQSITITVPEKNNAVIENSFTSDVTVYGAVSFSVSDAKFKCSQVTGDTPSLTYVINAVKDGETATSVKFEVTKTRNASTSTTVGYLTYVSGNVSFDGRVALTKK